MTKSSSGHTRRHRFNFRGLITYLVALSFLILLISGIMNFLAPSGRISREVGWSLLGLDRAAWQTLHLSFAVVFVAAGVVHITFNWEGLLHYLRDRTTRRVTLRWDTAIALLLTLWLGASAVLGLPPATTLHDLSTHFRQAFWVDGPSKRGTVAAPAKTDATGGLPSTDSVPLPQDHPPVPPDKACSDCHRQK